MRNDMLRQTLIWWAICILIVLFVLCAPDYWIVPAEHLATPTVPVAATCSAAARMQLERQWGYNERWSGQGGAAGSP